MSDLRTLDGIVEQLANDLREADKSTREDIESELTASRAGTMTEEERLDAINRADTNAAERSNAIASAIQQYVSRAVKLAADGVEI